MNRGYQRYRAPSPTAATTAPTMPAPAPDVVEVMEVAPAELPPVGTTEELKPIPAQEDLAAADVEQSWLQGVVVSRSEQGGVTVTPNVPSKPDGSSATDKLHYAYPTLNEGKVHILVFLEKGESKADTAKKATDAANAPVVEPPPPPEETTAATEAAAESETDE